MSAVSQQIAHASDSPAPTVGGGLAISGLDVDLGGQRILSSVDLAVPPGAYACVLGASGSGKSTLLAAIAGTVQPRAGSIQIHGETASNVARGIFLAPRQRRLGMVFQDYLLWPHLSALDNVALALRRREGRAGARAVADEWLERVGLGGLGRRYPAELSGGQQQRVALARALALTPRLVLLDEPLSALDAHIRGELRTLLRELAAEHGFSAVHVTHDAKEALSLADKLVVMHGGRVIQAGACQEVFMQPATSRVARLTGDASLVPVQVLSWENGRAVIQLGDRSFNAKGSSGLVSGAEAFLVLRPNSISMLPCREAIPLPARILNAFFLGDYWHIEAEIAGGVRVSFWHGERPQTEFNAYLRLDYAWVVPQESA